jgi:transketolase
MLNPDKLRLHVLSMVFNKKSGHIGGSFSLAELIAHLYSTCDLISDCGDKLVLSKGHAVPIVYAALYELGKIKTLDSFREINSELQGHPDRRRCKYMHATTGSLGQGLSIAVGHAIALRETGRWVYCILGDGECQEGQVYEAAMLAPRLGLENLICFIDANKMQCDGKTLVSPARVLECFAQFGWRVMAVNGNDAGEVADAVESSKHPFSDGAPKCVLLNTKKGAGIEVFTKDYGWHARVPTKDEYESAKAELEGRINGAS